MAWFRYSMDASMFVCLPFRSAVPSIGLILRQTLPWKWERLLHPISNLLVEQSKENGGKYYWNFSNRCKGALGLPLNHLGLYTQPWINLRKAKGIDYVNGQADPPTWSTRTDSRGWDLCFLLLEKRWANKSNHLLHSLPVTSFWIQNSSLGPREYCLMIVLLRGKMDPASPFFSCQQPLLCLHLNQVLGPKSAPGWFHYRPLVFRRTIFSNVPGVHQY